jgi:hypothetical protein
MATRSSRPAESAQERAERRAYQRVSLDVPALIDAIRSHHAGRCRDVSLGGVAVRTDAELAIGTELEVYFELPSGIAVETRATVVRCDAEEIALRFVELGAQTRVALRAYCRPSGVRAVSVNKLAVKFGKN